MPYDPLAFIRWEQVSALLIVVSGTILLFYLRFIKKEAEEAKRAATLSKATADETNEMAKQNHEATKKISKTLTETNSGTHVKDQLNRLEVKLSMVTKIFEDNKDMFQYMRRNFKHPEYFEDLEQSLQEIQYRLSQIDKHPTARGQMRQTRTERYRTRRKQ